VDIFEAGKDVTEEFLDPLITKGEVTAANAPLSETAFWVLRRIWDFRQHEGDWPDLRSLDNIVDRELGAELVEVAKKAAELDAPWDAIEPEPLPEFLMVRLGGMLLGPEL
jgi:hypothetical protein